MKVCPKCGTQYGDDANFCTADAGRLVAMAAPAAAPTPASSGLLGGRFQLGPRIGGGDTGAVHRATDTQSGATVAVKLIAPTVLTPPAQAQRVERELKMLERVQSPQVARVLASGKQGDQVWVATEWLEGALPLAAQVEAGLIDGERAVEVIAAIGGALLDAAKVGLVHRDLAPKNVLVVGDAIKLINFALPTPGERAPGVPGFSAPEALEGKPLDQRSTTYSLGAVAYFLLTGQPPFIGDPAAIAAAQLGGTVPPPSAQASITTAFDAVIGRAMDRNPARRYLTLKQFLDDLGKVQIGAVDPATTAPFGRVGKARESAQAVVLGAPTDHAKTRVMEVQIPPAALREEPTPEIPARRPIAPTIQAPAVPPPTAMAAAVAAQAAVAQAPEVDDMLTQRTPMLEAEEVHAAMAAAHAAPVEAAAPSPWAPPVAVAAVEAAAPTPASDVGPMTAAVQAMVRPVAAVEPPAARVVAAAESAAPAPRPKTASAPAPAGATGKKRPADVARKANKGKFRETLWFKKGDLDAAAAAEAARSTDAAAADKADTLPIEERYSDDGTVTSTDAERYSLKTGQTSSMPRYPDQAGAADDGPPVGEDELIGEMKSGRKKIIIAIAVGAVAIVAVVLAFAL